MHSYQSYLFHAKQRVKIAKVYVGFVGSLLRTQPNWRIWRLIFETRRHTYVSPEQLATVYQLVQSLEQTRRSGALVECGVWKGGCAALMSAALEQSHQKKDVWLFDSFQGMPEPKPIDGAKAIVYAGNKNQGKLEPINQCVAQVEDVVDLYHRLHLSLEQVHLVKGWFQDTMASTAPKIDQISLLRLDADWYESTQICLDYFFDKLNSGGYLVIDDYYRWQGCKQAVDECFTQRGIKPKLVKLDRWAVYWQKP